MDPLSPIEQATLYITCTIHFLLIGPLFHPHIFLSDGGLGIEDCTEHVEYLTHCLGVCAQIVCSSSQLLIMPVIIRGCIMVHVICNEDLCGSIFWKEKLIIYRHLSSKKLLRRVNDPLSQFSCTVNLMKSQRLLDSVGKWKFHGTAICQVHAACQMRKVLDHMESIKV